MSEYKFENLSPFKFFILETFPFIQQEYFDAMNEWQMFCKVGEKINEIINSQNSVGQETEALYNAFINLQNYINNYLDNLDIQEEVNNKLNDMAESGELGEIINQEIFTELNNKINAVKNMSNVENILQSNIIEDLVDNENNIQWYYPQGACSHNGLLYQYFQYLENGEKSEYGEIRIYNPKTFSKINTISGIKGYHGNDMCYLNNKLYIASCNVGSTLKNKLVVYDLGTNTTSEIDVGIDNNSLYGVTHYKDNKLILAYNNNSQDLNAQYYYIYDTETHSIQNLELNTNNFPINYWSYLQNIEYYDNCLYLLTSNCNSIIECVLEDNTLKITNIITLPLYDTRNLKVGECECLVNMKDSFGKNTLGLSCGAQRNQILDNAVFQFYLVNFKNGINETPVEYIWDTIQNMYNKLYVNNTSSTLLELGTKNFPFKDLSRAIQSTNKSNSHVQIIGGTNYKGCSVHSKQGICILIDTDFPNDVIINHLRFANSRVQIVNNSNHDVIIKNESNLYNSALFINDKTYLTLKNIIIDGNNKERGIWNDYSIIDLINCNVKNTTSKGIENTNGSILSTPTFDNCSNYYIYNSTGIVKVNNVSNVPYNKIYTSPSATTIYNGIHIDNMPKEYITEITDLISSLSVHQQSSITQCGKQILFNMLLINNTQVNFDNNTTIFVIPSSIRPSSNKGLSVNYNKNSGFCFCRASDGNIRIQLTGNIPANTEIYITGSYFID